MASPVPSPARRETHAAASPIRITRPLDQRVHFDLTDTVEINVRRLDPSPAGSAGIPSRHHRRSDAGAPSARLYRAAPGRSMRSLTKTKRNIVRSPRKANRATCRPGSAMAHVNQFVARPIAIDLEGRHVVSRCFSN